MSPSERENLRRQIEAGVSAGIARALAEHRRAGRKVAIWRDGKVELVLPPGEEDSAYGMREDAPEQSRE